ncbi:MAG: energy transducer TonB, partial [Vicinamibacterales bacterium]
CKTDAEGFLLLEDVDPGRHPLELLGGVVDVPASHHREHVVLVRLPFHEATAEDLEAHPVQVKRVEPTYPDLALVAKITGMVILEATVSTDGTVESVRVLRSVKFLDQAAVDAVKQWRYSPLVLNGVPTPFVLSVSLSFSVKS